MSRKPRYIDYTGQKMHRLTFLHYTETQDNGKARWRVRCDCGTEFEVSVASVKNGLTRSCGCLRRERCLEGFKKYLKKYQK